jgi:hypothetical protein
MLGRHTLGSGKTTQRRLAPLGPSPRGFSFAPKFGRKPMLSDFQRKEAIKRRAAGETLAEIAKSYAVDISMISRLS